MKTKTVLRLSLVCFATLSVGTLAGAAIQEPGNATVATSETIKATGNSAEGKATANSEPSSSKAPTADPFNDTDPFGTNSMGGSPGPRTLPNEAENNQNCAEILNQVYDLPPVVGMPLIEFVDMISEKYGMPTFIDENAFDDEGLDTEEEVDWKLTNIRLRTALSMILDTKDLTYLIKDGILVITTKTEAEDRQTTRVYDCSSLLANDQSLAALATKPGSPSGAGNSTNSLIMVLQNCVEPLSWEDNGGPAGAKIVPFRNKLIIRNTEAIHHDLRLLLDELAD